MKHAARAVATIAFGVALATAAQAHGIQHQSALPSGKTGSAALSRQAMNGQMQPGRTGQRVTRQDIRQAQQALKSEGLYKGRIDGRMGLATHRAIAEFQQRNGLQRTARLDRTTLSRLMGSQTTGVGSSNPNLQGMPANQSGMTAPLSTQTNGAGGGAATNQSPSEQTPSNHNLNR